MRLTILKKGELIETKELHEGQYHIGRSEENEICLASNKVSKQHALIVVKGSQAAVVDLGSSNGTFVNGVLVKKQRLQFEDIVSIGDFQMRYSRILPQELSVPSSSVGDGNLAEKVQPQGLVAIQEKAAQVMENKVLLPLYALMKVTDWRWILASIFTVALILSVFMGIRPVYNWATSIGTKEAIDRAHTVLEQVVRENFRSLQKGGEYARLSVEPWENIRGFRDIFILDGRNGNILAPVKLYNQSLGDSYALVAFNKAAKEGERKVTLLHEDGSYIIAQPIQQILQPGSNENNLGPAAIVLAQFNIEDVFTTLFEPMLEALLFSVFFGLLAYFLVMKMVTHPIQKIQEQLDAALRGEAVSIASEAKFEDLENLAQVINFSVAKIKQANGDLSNMPQDSDLESEDEQFVKTIMEVDMGAADALLLLNKEKKVRYVGRVLEELIGLRSQYAEGQNISDCCRDPGFSGTAIDLTERVLGSLGEIQTATLDINGINRFMTATPHRSQNGEIRFILLTVKMS